MAASVTWTRNSDALAQFGGGTVYIKQVTKAGADLTPTADDPQVIGLLADCEMDDDHKLENVEDADGHVWNTPGRRLVKLTLTSLQHDTAFLNWVKGTVGQYFMILVQATSDVSGQIGGKNQYALFGICQVDPSLKVKFKGPKPQVIVYALDNGGALTGLTLNDATKLAALVPAPLATLASGDGALTAHQQWGVFDK